MFKVLIVDDSEFIRKLIRDLPLWGERSGFVVSGEAENGKMALQMLEDKSYDLVITDICMPNVNGFELLQTIFERRLAPCVAILSQHAAFDYAKRGMIYGAVDYLTKPVDEQEVALLLERVKRRFEENGAKGATVAPTLAVREILPQRELEELIERMEDFYAKITEQTKAVSAHIIEKSGADGKLMKAAFHDAGQIIAQKIVTKYDWLEKYIDIFKIIEKRTVSLEEKETLALQFQLMTEELACMIREFTDLRCNGENAQKISRYMLRHVDEQLSLTKVAKKLYITRTYLGEVFKEKTNMSAREYLLFLKIARAKRLLAVRENNWDEIAMLLGYRSTEYFANLFAASTGCSPKQYRRKLFVSVDDE